MATSQKGFTNTGFSYDGKYSTHNVKNYYFWSAALAAMQMRERGYSKDLIRRVSMELPRQYKKMRKVEKYAKPLTRTGVSVAIAGAMAATSPRPIAAALVAPLVGFIVYYRTLKLYEIPITPSEFRQDAIEVMRNSAEGAMHALDAIEGQ